MRPLVGWCTQDEVREAETLTEILTLIEKLYVAEPPHIPLTLFTPNTTVHLPVPFVTSHLAIDTTPRSASMSGFLALLVSIMRTYTQLKLKIRLAYLKPNR